MNGKDLTDDQKNELKLEADLLSANKTILSSKIELLKKAANKEKNQIKPEGKQEGKDNKSSFLNGYEG